jgi:peptidoglycan/xylan/chitin deacetylase (PgdA/CDA1 family)
LDILEQNNVKATFFVIHYSEQNEHLIKREKEQGHTIALHGYSHTYSVVYQSADSCLENFRKIGEQVYQTTGINSKIIRFPGGLSNTVSRKYCEGVMTELSQRAIDEGYRIFDWNVDSDDAGSAKSSEDVYRNVTSHLSKDKANVVLMHDFANNTKTIGALERIIDFGLENGYTFEVITPDTQMVTHTTNN